MIPLRTTVLVLVGCSSLCGQSPATIPAHFAHLEFAPAPDASLQVPPAAGFWRNARNAGANALYVALQGHGLAVEYDAVVAAVEVTPRGANLQTLSTAAARLGLPMQPALASPETLDAYPRPLLLHLDPLARHVQEGGRIAVLVSIDEDGESATLIDGVTGIPSSVSSEDLFQVWSGALLATRRQPRTWAAWQTLGILLGFAIGGFGLGGVAGSLRGRAS